MSAILNLTQHLSTPEQVAQGVVNLPDKGRHELCELLTFDEPPKFFPTMLERAKAISDIAYEWFSSRGMLTRDGQVSVMLGGAPFFMSTLESELRKNFSWDGSHRIRIFYAFSIRESVETRNADGSVSKTNVFKHAGFVEV